MIGGFPPLATPRRKRYEESRVPVHLLADLVATNSRFAIAAPGGRLRHLRIFHAGDFVSPLAAIRHYLAGIPAADRPRDGALAVAAPIVGGRVRFVNRRWEFATETLRKQLGFGRLMVLNDLEAQAYALLSVGSADCKPIGRGRGAPGAPKLVIGPGTGLGMAALLTDSPVPRVISTEAGHLTLAATTAAEERVLAAIRKRYGRVSVERALSGPGLAALYRALSRGGRAELEPAEIARRAQAGRDATAVRTARLFSRLLGAFCGDMVLAYNALGGVYVVGGVVPGLGRAFDRRTFRAAFEEKGRYRDYLGRVPVYLVARKDLGLKGLTEYLRVMAQRKAT
jgi:glucokinase